MNESDTLLIQDIDNLIQGLKSYKRDIIRRGQLSDKAGEMDTSRFTIRQIEKTNADLNWLCMNIEKSTYFLHSLAVNLGISPLRTRQGYEAIEFMPSGFHTYKYYPPLPRGYSMEYFDGGAK